MSVCYPGPFPNSSTCDGRPDGDSTLEQIIAFRYLTPGQWEALIADASFEVSEPGSVLIERGDRHDARVFLTLDGSVRGRDVSGPGVAEARVVTAGHYIGEREALFEEARAVRVEAIDRVRALTVSGDRFLRLVHESTAFAQALGSILRDTQGIFMPFERFRVALLQEGSQGSVDLRSARMRASEGVLPLYATTREVLTEILNA